MGGNDDDKHVLIIKGGGVDMTKPDVILVKEEAALCQISRQETVLFTKVNSVPEMYRHANKGGSFVGVCVIITGNPQKMSQLHLF